MHSGLIAKQILEMRAQVGDPAVGSADTVEAHQGYEVHFLEPQDFEAGDISGRQSVIEAVIVLGGLGPLAPVRKTELRRTVFWSPRFVSDAIGTSDIQESNVTFDQSDDDLSEVQGEQAEINALLDAARIDLPEAIFVRLQQRFKFLFEPDEGETVQIAPGSVRQLLQFLRNNRELRAPSIVITNRRNVKAIWRASEKELFWIEFEPNDDVTFLAFSPNAKRSDGIERDWGLSTVGDVLRKSKQIGAFRWMQG